VTPAELFYVRSHGNVPEVEAESHALEIGRASGEPVRVTLTELKAALPQVTVPATLQCAGNRRQELMAARPITGELDWGAEAIGHAEWIGVRLRDVLRHAGLSPAPDEQHVAFGGLDETERLGQRFTFGGSICRLTVFPCGRWCPATSARAA
jgi:sulfite oxidase